MFGAAAESNRRERTLTRAVRGKHQVNQATTSMIPQGAFTLNGHEGEREDLTALKLC